MVLMAVSEMEAVEWDQNTCIQWEAGAEAQQMGYYPEDAMHGYWSQCCGYDQCKKRMCWDCVVEMGAKWNPKIIKGQKTFLTDLVGEARNKCSSDMGRVEKWPEQLGEMCKLKETMGREDHKQLSNWGSCLLPKEVWGRGSATFIGGVVGEVKVSIDQVIQNSYRAWWDPGNEAHASMAPVCVSLGGYGLA